MPEDWDLDTLRGALRDASDWVLKYRSTVGEHPVVPEIEPGDVRDRLGETPPRGPSSFADVLADFESQIVPGLTHWNHPGFLAYFSSCTKGPSIIAELLMAAVGVNAMIWRTSPAATEVERTAVDWLRQAVGLPDEFQGVILDTASTATFTALLAARERAGDNIRQEGVGSGPPLAVYTSEQSHSSLDKSVLAAGLGHRAVRHIQVDDAFSMCPAALAAVISKDVADGIRPAFVCATVGTTSTASVDPVERISAVARRYGAWLHVDSAYAGPAAMLPEERHHFEGWEGADSIVMNPHKWMGTSLDCSVLLFRDLEPFRTSLAILPEYLSTDVKAMDLMDVGLPLGRRFRGLKLWTLFRCIGTRGLQTTMRRHIELAQHAADRLQEGGVFELAAPVSFGTVCFRAPLPGHVDPEQGNRHILQKLNETGHSFLSHTALGGRYALRLSVGSVYTTMGHVDRTVDALREFAKEQLAKRTAKGV